MKQFRYLLLISLLLSDLQANNIEKDINKDQFFHENLYSLEFEYDNLRNDVFTEEKETDKDYDFVVITLGSNCRPAFFTRYHKIRFLAYPFDWCFTPYQSLYNLIKNDFKNFMIKNFLIPPIQTNLTPYLKDFINDIVGQSNLNMNKHVLDKYSEIIFPHDFQNNSSDEINKDYDLQYAKYKRRIDYFYNAINSEKHIYFIRDLNMNKNETCELRDLILKKFPNLKFTLIVIGCDKNEFLNDWNLKYIKNFFLARPIQFNVGEEFWVNLYKNIINGSFK